MALNYYWKSPPKSAALRSWAEIAPSSGIAPVGGHINPYAIIDYLTEEFNRLPAAYKTDPITGGVTATKSMPKPEMPSEMAAYTGLQSYFKAPPKSSYLTGPTWGYKQPAAPETTDLSFSWTLPKGALTAPSVIGRNVPQSEYERVTGYNLGISGLGAPNLAAVNPLSYWPKTAFRVPLTEAYAGEGQRPTPAFGGKVSYETGKWFMPPDQWTETYGRIPSAMKTPPGYGGLPTIGRYTPMSFTGGGQERIAALKARKPPLTEEQVKRKQKRDWLISTLSGVYKRHIS